MSHYQCGEAGQRIGNYLGLAMKAGRIAAGDAAAQKALQAGKAQLLVVAEDIAPATAAQLLKMADVQGIGVLWWPDKLSLGLIVGKSRRGALALLDEGFGEAILKICQPKATD